MSCRVLGRKVEFATLEALVEQAARSGATRLLGEYRPTPKNGMVRDHYARLGFRSLGSLANGTTRWELDIGEFHPEEIHIHVYEEMNEKRRLQPAH
jgi:predicted enzyme involved in methoxymalonyl-ACP biosynthesis